MFMWTPRYNGSDLYNRWMGWKMNFLITSHLIIDNDCNMIGLHQLTIVWSLWPQPSLLWREWCSEAWNAFTECQEFGLFPRPSQPHNEPTQKMKVWLKYFDLYLNTTRDANYECFPQHIETKDVFPIKMWTTCKMKISSPAEEWDGM